MTIIGGRRRWRIPGELAPRVRLRSRFVDEAITRDAELGAAIEEFLPALDVSAEIAANILAHSLDATAHHEHGLGQFPQVLERWTNATRPTKPQVGRIGFNTETLRCEVWSGSTWIPLVS